MILTNRLFQRETPSRDAKSIFIFCEGEKKEYQYFQYFIEKDSRLNLEIYPRKSNEDNSPVGLLNITKKCILKTDENQNPKYDFEDGDEVWIVIDTDTFKNPHRQAQIQVVLRECNMQKGWNLAISNPCFEVWLYYHRFSEFPILTNIESCNEWKQYIDTMITGGFDSRRHPIFIEQACINAKSNYKTTNNIPDTGCTNLFILANIITFLLKEKLANVLNVCKI